jgi:hypothetical protein
MTLDQVAIAGFDFRRYAMRPTPAKRSSSSPSVRFGHAGNHRHAAKAAATVPSHVHRFTPDGFSFFFRQYLVDFGDPIDGSLFAGEAVDCFGLATPNNFHHPAKSGIAFSHLENGWLRHLVNIRLCGTGTNSIHQSLSEPIRLAALLPLAWHFSRHHQISDDKIRRNANKRRHPQRKYGAPDLVHAVLYRILGGAGGFVLIPRWSQRAYASCQAASLRHSDRAFSSWSRQKKAARRRLVGIGDDGVGERG